ncbi:head GIN domain-containing protein [Flavobacterium saliperosum]|uniref:Putative auto-transporter adhesin, head GIN domain n=2 Tax=Flavobacterium saliperosum TaxID=329186 RepID=A0A1G4VWJ9_9FLAO|nr:head GIN domain-containing protein [Flavobacterium saliperosum]SCX12527.1 Putative auto-transporter adhesin, head GIN domain [Flavobacterium saliperosum]
MRTKLVSCLAVMLLLVSCESEIIPGCYREPGASIIRVDAVAVFNQINIGEGVNLVVKQGTTAEVKVETGENIIDEVTTEVVDGVLYVKNNLQCSLGTTIPAKVTVTAPDIVKIYSSSQYDVVSEGILNFPYLNLQQGLFGKTASNIFDLNVNCLNLVVENNNTTIFRIKGTTNSLNVSFYAGDSRFEGGNLTVQDVFIFQRSSNDMILKPSNKIEGNIYSNGNVILLSQPPIVNVTEHYTGHVIYQ